MYPYSGGQAYRSRPPQPGSGVSAGFIVAIVLGVLAAPIGVFMMLISFGGFVQGDTEAATAVLVIGAALTAASVGVPVAIGVAGARRRRRMRAGGMGTYGPPVQWPADQGYGPPQGYGYGPPHQ
ncbi:hypothetical protein CLV63_12756 [Murinocardiopsis flavida]|uniref:Uncharacterized protein n=1 Tax=Murinocardiopsis flavida TaxID=645275 RepID=A0A2P8CW25_9ACTN|nr:hypothetical protein [Murinocardiopsis flavida]PSK89183.1 hypothetical protein CLV63_12756 [Murinocardiopsis flavida]